MIVPSQVKAGFAVGLVTGVASAVGRISMMAALLLDRRLELLVLLLLGCFLVDRRHELLLGLRTLDHLLRHPLLELLPRKAALRRTQVLRGYRCLRYLCVVVVVVFAPPVLPC